WLLRDAHTYGKSGNDNGLRSLHANEPRFMSFIHTDPTPLSHTHTHTHTHTFIHTDPPTLSHTHTHTLNLTHTHTCSDTHSPTQHVCTVCNTTVCFCHFYHIYVFYVCTPVSRL